MNIRNVGLCPGKKLTRREIEILSLVAVGLTGQSISKELGISAQTVHTHKTNILIKTGANNITQTVTWCIQEGLLTVASKN